LRVVREVGAHLRPRLVPKVRFLRAAALEHFNARVLLQVPACACASGCKAQAVSNTKGEVAASTRRTAKGLKSHTWESRCRGRSASSASVFGSPPSRRLAHSGRPRSGSGARACSFCFPEPRNQTPHQREHLRCPGAPMSSLFAQGVRYY
jgi:hypothetical protein